MGMQGESSPSNLPLPAVCVPRFSSGPVLPTSWTVLAIRREAGKALNSWVHSAVNCTYC